MVEIQLISVSVSFENWSMKNFSLKVPSGSFCVIVGPSGCGKTTLLRLVAGLQELESGKIFFAKKDITKLPAEQRDIGFVFQNDALFSHMSVFENVAFGLAQKKESENEKKVKNALSLVHLEGFEKRSVTTLSSGQRKRVAIARAICYSPKALLLDEPLSSLDAKLKEKMKLLLKEISQKTKTTIIMVTHDIDEGFYLADLLVVMSNGQIEQTGPALEVFKFPKTDFVKDFVSDYEVVEAKSKKNGLFEGHFSVPLNKRAKKVFF